MKVAVGILSLVATKAAASVSTKEQDKGAVSSESKRASKDQSSKGSLKDAEVSSAAFDEAERVKAETLDAGVLDVGTAASCKKTELAACFDEAATLNETFDCDGEISAMCFEGVNDDAPPNTADLIPCLGEGATAEDAKDQCYYSMCFVDCRYDENDAQVEDSVYDTCANACYGDDTETGSTKVPSVLAQV